MNNRIVCNTITLLKQKLEEKKRLVEMIKNPEAFRSESPKNYLASEKLAYTKKQRSVSPVKIVIDESLKKNGVRRVKSVVRKTRK
jgi:hypothetical protein